MMRSRGHRLAAFAVNLVMPLVVCGCKSAPMNYFHTHGPAADPITSLGLGLTLICCLVVLIIGAVVLIGAWRARIPKGELSAVALTNSRDGLRWIYIGTGISTVVLLVIVVWTLFTLSAVSSAPQSPVFTIEIRAHQWWWEARYIGDISSRTFTTANELHIPVGQPVRLRLMSDDVIHSFWIPALAGKTDVIPGQTNTAWIQANEAGNYRGQCAEYCGEQHAHMAEFVIADSPDDFHSWWEDQLAETQAPQSSDLQQGETIFLAHCAACHTVRGIAAGGILGPDLTHLMSRNTLGAGALSNDAQSLRRWIANAQEVKLGCRMPKLDLSQSELDSVTAYVQTLR